MAFNHGFRFDQRYPLAERMLGTLVPLARREERNAIEVSTSKNLLIVGEIECVSYRQPWQCWLR